MFVASSVQFGLEQTSVSNASIFITSPWIFNLVMLGIFFLVLVVMGVITRNILGKKSRVPAAMNMKILLLSVPKESLKKEGREDTPQTMQEEIGVAESIFSALGGLRSQRSIKSWLFGRTDHFSVEIVLDKGNIYFYIAIPENLQETLTQQILSAYPHALIEEVKDYNIFLSQGKVAGAYMRFGRDFIFPIKTFRKTEGDPLNTLTNALSNFSANGEAVIQFVCRSSHKRWHRRGVKVARAMQQGKSFNIALKMAGFGNIFDKIGSVFGAIFSLFTKAKQDLNKPDETYRMSAMEEEAVKGMEEKSSKAGLDVNIRIVTSAPKKEQAESYLENIINAFAQYNIYEYGNGFKKAKFVKLPRLISDFIHRSYYEKYRVILNSEEMASLWHMPLPSSETPNIYWLEARKAPPPFKVPDEGLLLGQNIYRGTKTPIRINEDDRMRHTYIIGKSGTGKSVLQSNMIIQDIKAGKGVCVIDPHGDLIDAVMGHIPADRAEDVILFDPADSERPIGLNMMEFNSPEQKTFVINEIINIFDKLYDLKATGGPMFEQYMRNAMQLMMEDEESGSTLLEIPKVLADSNFRKYKLSKCVNPVVKDFWEKEAEKAGGEASLANMVPYITSKLTPFVASDLIRPIIAQQKSSFNFREAMDNEQIMLIKLSKGKIGDMSANLLGMIIVGKILMAALARVDLPEDERKTFYLYIDEFQNFTTDSIAIILSEARKYKLGLIIAHQYIGQLVKNNDTSIKDAVFGNVGTMASFRIGPDDAEFMAKQFSPVFSEYDIINIPKYNAYIKLLIDNQNPPAFNLETFAPESGNKAIAEKVRELSRLKYGRDRNIVEAEILARVKMADKKEPAPTDRITKNDM